MLGTLLGAPLGALLVPQRGLTRRMSAPADLRSWQRRVFLTCWLTYGSFYLCRVNLSVALPAIQQEFGWSKTSVGLIGSALFWVYAAGQLVNGQLGDRVRARRFVAAGLLASVALNVAFGFAASLPLMIAIWAANGYVQSMGWGPIVRTISRWFGPQRRGRLSALMGPSYVLGHAGSWLLSGWLLVRFGWRAAFWVPAALVALSALHWTVRVRDDPQEVGLAAPEGASARPAAASAGWQGGLRRTFAHPRLRWAGLVNGALGIVRGSSTLWAPTYLLEALNVDIGGAAVSAVVLPLCGLAGVLTAGWASDRFHGSRVAPITALGVAGLFASALATRFLAPWGGLLLAVSLLGLTAALIHGAGSLLVTVLPLSLSREGGVSSAAGFIDFAGYVGSGVGGLLTGLLVDGWGWNAMFIFWTLAAVLAMVATVPLWRSEAGAGSRG